MVVPNVMTSVPVVLYVTVPDPLTANLRTVPFAGDVGRVTVKEDPALIS